MSLRSLLREPLLHFLALGAALFLYFQWSGGGTGADSGRIVLTAGQIEHLAAGFTRAWQRPPEEEELKALIDDWIREEIAVRKAMEMGIDRDDTVIRRRLRQKFEFLVEDVTATASPTEAELQAWLESHAEAFGAEPEMALRQVYVGRDRRGAAADADARTLLEQLRAGGPSIRIEDLGDPISLPQELPLAPRSEISRLFGPDFARGLEPIPPGVWSGPIESGYGLHLVLVSERSSGSLPELAAVRNSVERGYMADRREKQLAEMYQRLLEEYKVVVERPGEAQ